MKTRLATLLVLAFFLMSCGAASSPVPVNELPDPVIYAVTQADLPEVGLPWQQTYNQTSVEEGYKWSYQAYQAYQPGNMGVELESGFAVNNDVVLYGNDVSHQDLPKPPETLGDIENVKWKTATQPHQLGDKSAVWKTALGENLTPAWWLEFYQDHAYVRISLLGFPDQIAPAILYGMGDIVSSRLPQTVEELRSDATEVATRPGATPTQFPQVTATPLPALPTPPGTPPPPQAQIYPVSYTAPPGETGMVTFFDDTGNQLTDGVTGGDDLLVDQGQGTGYEWVGWTEATEPVTLTFTFDGEPTITTVSIGFNHRDGLGIFPPSFVSINGTSFEVDPNAIPNNQRGDLVFSGDFGGPKLEIVLHHQGRGWILVDEVRFFAQP